jgi:hypothetical protein
MRVSTVRIAPLSLGVLFAVVLCTSGTVLAGPRLAVMDLADTTRTLSAATLEALTDTLRSQLAQSGGFVVIDKSRQAEALKRLILMLKKESYRHCTDDRCQIPLGHALAADSLFRAKLSLLGPTYVITGEVIDLQSETVRSAAQETVTLQPRADREDRLRVAAQNVVQRVALAHAGKPDGEDLSAPMGLLVSPASEAKGRKPFKVVKLAGELPQGGVGTLVSVRRDGVEEPLLLKRVAIYAKQTGDMVETHIEHLFHNATAERTEGTFRFPLAQGSTLIGLAMEVNGRLVEGELLERRKARAVYESIVERMQDPALLEWEEGNVFKLRVFPIEPRSDKRVIIRTLVPLKQLQSSWHYLLSTAYSGKDNKVERFLLSFNGETLVDEQPFGLGPHISVPVKEAVWADGVAWGERTREGLYLALRVNPKLRPLPASRRAPPRSVLFLVDVSRSTLESRPLLLSSLETLLRGLGPEDRFSILTFDISCRSLEGGFVLKRPEALRRALDFVRSIEPDGASDLGLAFRCAGEAMPPKDRAGGHVVYVGDGVATWGETNVDRLVGIARRALEGVPLHSMILGRQINTDLSERVTGERGGKTVHPLTKDDVQWFAEFLRTANQQDRLDRVVLSSGHGQLLYPSHPGTLFAGDDLVALVFLPHDKAAPSSIQLTATHEGKELRMSFPIHQVVPTLHVARRWGAKRIAQLEAEGGKEAEIVEVSLKHRVMSRYTSFLVLENEEAYERFQIARDRRSRSPSFSLSEPSITGQDLESLDSKAVAGRMSVDQFVPGDPEIEVEAPASARKVTLVFPWGDIKACAKDPMTNKWMASFLVPDATPDGIYTIQVLITLENGEQLARVLNYQVDGTAPRVEVKLSEERVAPGAALEIIVTPLSLSPPLPLAKNSIGDPSFAVRVTQDIARAEAVLPTRTTVRLERGVDGTFRCRFHAPAQSGVYEIPVAVRDHARNKVIRRLELRVAR